MARKKVKWGPGNPLYDWKHKSSSTHSRKRSRGNNMARRRRYGRKSGSGKSVFGLSTKGLIGSYGIVGALAGAFLAPTIASMVPVDIPFKNEAAAFAIGGPAGVVGYIGKNMLMGGNVSSNVSW